MAVETADDILDFLGIDDFAENATYTPSGGSASTVVGIFDAPQASRSITDMGDVTIPAPQFVCRTIDVSAVAEGDALTVRSVAYYVRVVLHDGTGVTTLLLERV